MNGNSLKSRRARIPTCTLQWSMSFNFKNDARSTRILCILYVKYYIYVERERERKRATAIDGMLMYGVCVCNLSVHSIFGDALCISNVARLLLISDQTNICYYKLDSITVSTFCRSSSPRSFYGILVHTAYCKRNANTQGNGMEIIIATMITAAATEIAAEISIKMNWIAPHTRKWVK